VLRVKKGDRVVIPFTISCGECFYCNLKLFAACETTNTGRGAIVNKKDTRPGAALFGYSHLYGGIPGGQAQFVRVPKANVGPLVIPDSGLRDEQVLFLSDILPTGYMAAINAAIGKGSTVAIFGACSAQSESSWSTIIPTAWISHSRRTGWSRSTSTTPTTRPT
jgi:threonine dehydrogenase-like Zn-dependent dehydrogenase